MEAVSGAEDSRQDARSQTAALVVQPVAWLVVAAGGIVGMCVGVGIEAYRHNGGGAPTEVLSASSPGALLALGGLALTALGVLAALALLALSGEMAPGTAIRRAVGLTVLAVVVVSAGVGTITYMAVAGTTIGDDTSASSSGGQQPAATAPAVLRGSLTIDGQPLDAQFLGVRVIRDGLMAACQQSLPAVSAGQYQIGVLSDAVVPGCGGSGARIVLWTNAGGKTLYSQDSAAWPGAGAAATFDTAFSTSDAQGANQPATGFYAKATKSGAPVPIGTPIRALIGGTLCGESVVRNFDGDVGAILTVAGPQVDGCTKDGQITFEVDGQRATQTATNNLSDGGSQDALILTVP